MSRLYAGPTPDGSYISRTTYNPYTWAVAIISTAELVYKPTDKKAIDGYIANPDFGRWVSGSWHTRKDLAQKAMESKRGHGSRCVVVPVIDGKPPVVNAAQADLLAAADELGIDLGPEANAQRASQELLDAAAELGIDLGTAPAPRNTPKIKKVARQPRAKDQGFPAVYCGPMGNFKPGLDARAKSDLKAAVAGKRTGKELHTFTAKRAAELLKARGW